MAKKDFNKYCVQCGNTLTTIYLGGCDIFSLSCSSSMCPNYGLLQVGLDRKIKKVLKKARKYCQNLLKK